MNKHQHTSKPESKIVKARNRWRDSVTSKITILAYGLIISSIVLTGIFNFISQRDTIIERMKIEAENVTESIIQAHSVSLFTENYEAVIEFCTKLVKSSSSIEFIVITKADGNSLIFKKNNWNFEKLSGKWVNAEQFREGIVDTSKVLGKASFHFSKPFIFTGVYWGYVHIGISLETYDESLKTHILRIIIFSFLYMILGFFVTRIFSKILIKPVNEIVKTIREIENGNLKARAKIINNDDFGMLAKYFNTMTEVIYKNNEVLESTVAARTNELEKANTMLLKEIDEKETLVVY